MNSAFKLSLGIFALSLLGTTVPLETWATTSSSTPSTTPSGTNSNFSLLSPLPEPGDFISTNKDGTKTGENLSIRFFSTNASPDEIFKTANLISTIKPNQKLGVSFSKDGIVTHIQLIDQATGKVELKAMDELREKLASAGYITERAAISTSGVGYIVTEDIDMHTRNIKLEIASESAFKFNSRFELHGEVTTVLISQATPKDIGKSDSLDFLLFQDAGNRACSVLSLFPEMIFLLQRAVRLRT